MPLRHRDVCDLILYELYWFAADSDGDLYDIAPNDLLSLIEDRTSEAFFRAAIDKVGDQGYIELAGRLPDTIAITRQGIEYVDKELDDPNTFLWDEHQKRPAGYKVEVPAASRYVEIDHNSQSYKEVLRTGEELIEAVRSSNEYADSDRDDQEQRLAELKAGYELLRSVRVDKGYVKGLLVGVVAYLTTKFADEAYR